ncbi:MAG: hypothetical protein LKG61_08700 [Solobacterium sp.]|jgi:CRP-like cAMP-binding protein|nr:hypothetical protein [Solobacterium sp.]
MRTIEDREQIRKWIEQYNIYDCFDSSGLEFTACIFAAGETIVSPADRMDRIMFALKGSVRIYGIHRDGSYTPVSKENVPFLLGDLEYAEKGKSVFFAEAAEETVFLCLSLSRYRDVLDHDARFLRFLLKSCSDKLMMISTFDPVGLSLYERVLLYLTDEETSHEIIHLDPLLLRLRCSRRQLQRVLKKLCMDGKIQKTGKGHYILKEPSGTAADTATPLQGH